MKIDKSKYVEIGKVCRYLGKVVCLKLPKIHTVTGCDTTSFFYGISKIRALKKLMKDNSKLELFDSLGKVLYNGIENESLVETRIRLYKAMKTKSSQALPPDPDSMTEAIKRMHFQTYYCLRFNDRIPDEIDYSKNGWKEESGVVVPIWFTGKYI